MKLQTLRDSQGNIVEVGCILIVSIRNEIALAAVRQVLPPLHGRGAKLRVELLMGCPSAGTETRGGRVMDIPVRGNILRLDSAAVLHDKLVEESHRETMVVDRKDYEEFLAHSHAIPQTSADEELTLKVNDLSNHLADQLKEHVHQRSRIPPKIEDSYVPAPSFVWVSREDQWNTK